jgi:hypothetical protein
MVLCTCGHMMSSHHRTGCAGELTRRCACTNDRYQALEAAVAAATRPPRLQPRTRVAIRTLDRMR